MKTAIELAEESLNRVDPDFSEDEPYWRGSEDEIERFAELVRADEREACAKVCDAFEVPAQIQGAHPDYVIGKEMAASQLAAAIRARGNT
jgi:ATP-dependent protease Clp ATPase subunit